MIRRVLLLGSTGQDKARVAERVKERGARLERSVEFVDYENTYLKPKTKSLAAYLAKDPYDQASIWLDAWDDFSPARDPDPMRETDVFLLIVHGCVVTAFYGTSQALDVHRICVDFQPDLIVTLTDDVYNLWWRAESRSPSALHSGHPTLEHLLMARRVEAMIGDRIAATSSRMLHQRVRNILLPVNHPVEVLENLIFYDAKPVYLSFPISGPRRWLDSNSEEDRHTGKKLADVINDFHRLANQSQRMSKHLAYISPLAIDELPLVRVAQGVLDELPHEEQRQLDSEREKRRDEPKRTFEFDPGHHRWQVQDLWPDTRLLASGVAARPLELEQAINIRGLIKTDISWRDNRLVIHSDCLVVFCPVMPRVDGSHRMSGGVKEELERASGIVTPCYVYQNPELDPTGVFDSYVGKPGSMGASPKHESIYVVETLDELFGAVTGHLSPSRFN